MNTDQHHRIISPRHPVRNAELHRYLRRRELEAMITHQASLEPANGGWSYDFARLQWVYRRGQWE